MLLNKVHQNEEYNKVCHTKQSKGLLKEYSCYFVGDCLIIQCSHQDYVMHAGHF